MVKEVANGYPSVTQALELENFRKLFAVFATETRRDLAYYFVELVARKELRLGTIEHVTALLDVITPLVLWPLHPPPP